MRYDDCPKHCPDGGGLILDPTDWAETVKDEPCLCSVPPWERQGKYRPREKDLHILQNWYERQALTYG